MEVGPLARRDMKRLYQGSRGRRNENQDFGAIWRPIKSDRAISQVQFLSDDRAARNVEDVEIGITEKTSCRK